jgi:hypothetical protein
VEVGAKSGSFVFQGWPHRSTLGSGESGERGYCCEVL